MFVTDDTDGAPPMATDSPDSTRDRTLAEWEVKINDQKALLADPAGRISLLTDEANQARRQGLITEEDLRELLEWIDAANAWAQEELQGRS